MDDYELIEKLIQIIERQSNIIRGLYGVAKQAELISSIDDSVEDILAKADKIVEDNIL